MICSPLEARAVKKKFGKNFLAVTPGIRPDWGDGADDQKRKATPGMAVSNKADLLVIGRPIRDAADPVEAAEKINREVETALKQI